MLSADVLGASPDVPVTGLGSESTASAVPAGTPRLNLYDVRISSSIGPHRKENSPTRGELRETVRTERKTNPEVRALYSSFLYGKMMDLAQLNRPDPSGGNLLDNVLRSGAIGIDKTLLAKLTKNISDGAGGFVDIEPDVSKIDAFVSTYAGEKIADQIMRLDTMLLEASMGMAYATDPSNSRSPNELQARSIPLYDKGALRKALQDRLLPYLATNTSTIAGRQNPNARMRGRLGSRAAKILGGAIAGGGSVAAGSVLGGMGFGAALGLPAGPIGALAGGLAGLGGAATSAVLFEKLKPGMQLTPEISTNSLKLVQGNEGLKRYMKEVMHVDADDFMVNGNQIQRRDPNVRTSGSSLDPETVREKLLGNMFTHFTYLNTELHIPPKNIDNNDITSLMNNARLLDDQSSLRTEKDVRRWFNANEGGIMSFCLRSDGSLAVDPAGRPILQPRLTRNVYRTLNGNVLTDPNGVLRVDPATGLPMLERDASGQPIVLDNPILNRMFDVTRLDQIGNLERYFKARTEILKQDTRQYFLKEMMSKRNRLQESFTRAKERAAKYADGGEVYKKKKEAIETEKRKYEGDKKIVDDEKTPMEAYAKALDELAKDEKALSELLAKIGDQTGTTTTSESQALEAINNVLNKEEVTLSGSAAPVPTKITIDGRTIISIAKKDDDFAQESANEYDSSPGRPLARRTGENDKAYAARFDKLAEGIEKRLQRKKQPIDEERKLLIDTRNEITRLRDSIAQKRADLEPSKEVVTKAADVVGKMTKSYSELTGWGITFAVDDSVDSVLSRINGLYNPAAPTTGWPATENGNVARRTIVANAIAEARSQSLLARRTNTDLDAFFQGGFNLSESDLLNKSDSEILAEMTANNAANVTAGGWDTNPSRLENAIKVAKERVKVRLQTLKNVSEQLDDSITRQDERINTIDIGTGGEKYKMYQELMTAQRVDAINQRLMEVANDPNYDPRFSPTSATPLVGSNGLLYFAQGGLVPREDPIQQGATEYIREEQQSNLPPGYIRTLRLVFQYHTKDNPAQAFQTAKEILPPGAFADAMANFLEMRTRPTGTEQQRVRAVMTELTNQIQAGNVREEDLFQFIKGQVIENYLYKKLDNPVTV